MPWGKRKRNNTNPAFSSILDQQNKKKRDGFKSAWTVFQNREGNIREDEKEEENSDDIIERMGFRVIYPTQQFKNDTFQEDSVAPISMQKSYAQEKRMKAIINKLIEITGPKTVFDTKKNKLVSVSPEIDDETGLSTSQKEIYEMALNGESFFFTGAAGTGKSKVLNAISEALREKYMHNPGAVHVTAPTGQAAHNVSGVTIHSWAGIGTGKKSATHYVNFIMSKKGKFNRDRILKTRVLIIDEISMVSADMFDLIERICNNVKNSDKPFGGIQIIACGDFFQLPPVEAMCTFKASTWNKTMKCSMVLTDNFRQGEDLYFAKILNEIRFGIVSQEALDLLDNCMVPFDKRDSDDNRSKYSLGANQGKSSILSEFISDQDYSNFNEEYDDEEENKEPEIKCTILYTTKRNVFEENKEKLDQLESEMVVFESEDTICQVRRRNKFVSPSPKQKEYFQGILRREQQIPEKIYLKKEAQVILTKNLNVSKGLTNGARGVVIEIKDTSDKGKCPVVQFSNGMKVTIHKHDFEIRNADQVVAIRKQIPLILGYAITVHKSQGMTLSKVKMDISNCFANGQAYTALSRAESTEGLEIMAYQPSAIKADKEVIDFYYQMHKELIDQSLEI